MLHNIFQLVIQLVKNPMLLRPTNGAIMQIKKPWHGKPLCEHTAAVTSFELYYLNSSDLLNAFPASLLLQYLCAIEHVESVIACGGDHLFFWLCQDLITCGSITIQRNKGISTLWTCNPHRSLLSSDRWFSHIDSLPALHHGHLSQFTSVGGLRRETTCSTSPRITLVSSVHYSRRLYTCFSSWLTGLTTSAGCSCFQWLCNLSSKAANSQVLNYNLSVQA